MVQSSRHSPVEIEQFGSATCISTTLAVVAYIVLVVGLMECTPITNDELPWSLHHRVILKLFRSAMKFKSSQNRPYCCTKQLISYQWLAAGKHHSSLNTANCLIDP
ncbi:hypothetical protein K493DRAFT_17177 [Basidiobolus meristosporus CBS 931.73]|uniref:Uncharacterized protein n=1 Tax=Basidiobolus meristosporus CBS 931.73 TaxID=1314790 RepID=A0A1Y1YFQ4_9FUNG|nr:hypothetical protein K493DRAFT_17177 [Basidiobolus meristosporus CBS 931.73]|eukprot:ORX96817.1 hypothetical protein K493DRAFT_17177 [Basidiobolus meristosporus CBS 931.73]